ncbi:hypothetical protein [Polyangium jinanense]|uniref:Uncharacterized protein n=1 Tax=Polyangium jinanense TaxID=2829994 RepID=A0A9X3X840_9BACT|nr:hypothetical protein [Polyangium jinanense]MDC3960580.1 hypothetical protein [Polyangium jinanense]MDC3985442.1 hypothetical protein [Polyangium jinanense]
MATTTTANGTTSRGEGAALVRNLDDLAKLSSAELDRLYRAAPAPMSVERLVGTPKGRMLAVRGTDGTPLFSALKFLASRRRFPWDGKSFGALDRSEGTGINRVKLLPFRFDWFPFRTRIEPSAVDDRPCVYLDYEQPGNPFFIARIRDEIREVAPDVWLGPAMVKTKKGAVHVLWFAVDFGKPSA